MSALKALLRKMDAELEPHRVAVLERMQNNTADAADYALYTKLLISHSLAQQYVPSLNRALTPKPLT